MLEWEREQQLKQKRNKNLQYIFYTLIPVVIIAFWSLSQYLVPDMKIAPQIDPYVEYQQIETPPSFN